MVNAGCFYNIKQLVKRIVSAHRGKDNIFEEEVRFQKTLKLEENVETGVKNFHHKLYVQRDIF